MSGENGESQNETPSESDKMDISEVSDQVSPVSDQSASDPVDNPAPKVSSPKGLVLLDNASASVSPSTTNTTTTTITANTTRDKFDSALSLEGFDLELPTLDTYQEEYVDFPSSPKQLKECLEAHGMAMPLERDSGTTGRSEEEDEEDTSIYQAVLSPDCQDVRLKKEHSEEVISVINEQHLSIENSAPNYEDDHPTDQNKKEDLTDVIGNVDKAYEHSDSLKFRLRRVLTPNPEDTMLPNLYGNRAAIEVLPDSIPQTPPHSSVNLTKAISSHDLKLLSSNKKSSASNIDVKSHSNLDLRMSGDFSGDSVKEDSSFIFERRNSKRLAKKDFGGRVVEGLFVESPLIKDKSGACRSGLRKIPLSQSLQNMESPTGEDLQVPDENLPSAYETQDSVSEFEERHNYANDNINTVFERIPQSVDIQNKIVTSVEIHSEQGESSGNQHVSKVHSRPVTKVYSTLNSQHQPIKSPPCPKPRRKWKSLSESGVKVSNNSGKVSEGVELIRGPVLLLDTVTLQHQTSGRGAPNIKPDGSVEIRQGWSWIHPWW